MDALSQDTAPVLTSVLDFLSPLVDLSAQRVSLVRLAHDPDGLRHASQACPMAPVPSLALHEISTLEELSSRQLCSCADTESALWVSLGVFDPLAELARDLPVVGTQEAEFFAATMLSVLSPSKWVPTSAVSKALDILSPYSLAQSDPPPGALILVCRGSHASLPTPVVARLPYAVHHDVRGFSLLLEPNPSELPISASVVTVAPRASLEQVRRVTPLFAELFRDGSAGFDPQTAYAAAQVLLQPSRV